MQKASNVSVSLNSWKSAMDDLLDWNEAGQFLIALVNFIAEELNA